MKARRHILVRRCFGAIAAFALFVPNTLLAGADDGSAPVMPAGTHLHFHVTAPISSSGSTSGAPFAFALLEPIVLAGATIPVEGTTGAGTIFLAGHAGTPYLTGD